MGDVALKLRFIDTNPLIISENGKHCNLTYISFEIIRFQSLLTELYCHLLLVVLCSLCSFILTHLRILHF